MGSVLLTGASGFLGQHILKAWPHHQITVLGRSHIPGYPQLEVDLRHSFRVDTHFETVVHAAGLAHVIPKNSQQADEFHQVNVEGTRHLLQALAGDHLPRQFVFISSVAVYGLTTGENIHEDFPLLAADPYGASKVSAEKLVTQWCDQNQVKLTILRLPLVCGVGAPGNLGKMVKAVQKNRWMHIAGGNARRSMVLAFDVAAVVEKAWSIGGTYNLTDGEHPSYRQLYEKMARFYQAGKAPNIPLWLAQGLAKLGDLWGGSFPINSKVLEKLTKNLIFEDKKAREYLNWKPRPVLAEMDAILE